MKKRSPANKGKAIPKPSAKKKLPRKRVSETAKRKPVMRFTREGRSKS